MPVHEWTRVSAGIFHDFHVAWIAALRNALNDGLLPPDYYALAEQIAGSLGPDVLTLRAPMSPGETPVGAPQGALAVAAAPPKVRFTARSEADQYTRRRRTIVIRHSSGDRVIALIEILSPGNKSSRNALRTFVEKAAAAIDRGIHLLLVDLFPPGKRDPRGIHGAVWEELVGDLYDMPPDKTLTLASYAAGLDKTAYIEPIAAGDALPDMPLFLTPDEYISVPLEATYQAAYRGVPKRWRDVLEARDQNSGAS